MEVLTRGQIKGRAIARARLKGESALDGQPDNPLIVEEYLEEIADILSGVVNQAYQTFTLDLESGKASYCAAPLTFLESAFVRKSDGATRFPLTILRTEDVSPVAPTWREEAPADFPQILVTEGFMGGFTLWPTPNYDRSEGVTVRGFGPYNRTLWPDDSDACPLPGPAHALLVNGLASKLARDDGNAERAATLWQDFWTAKGRYEANAAVYTNRTRSRRGDGPDTTSPTYAASPISPFFPF